MKTISSRDNSIVKAAASLKEKKYRDALGLYLLEGPNPIREYMDIGGRPRFIFIKAGAGEELQKIAASAQEPTAVYELSEDAFLKIPSPGNPQGIIAVAEENILSEKEFMEKIGDRNILVLDRIQDPGNTGTLLRTAEAMGFGGAIFIQGSADPYQPKVVRAAASSVFRLPMLFVKDAEQALALLAAAGKNVFSACMTGDVSADKADLKKNAAIIIGNEGNGVGEVFLKNSRRVFIPMEGKTESLNAAVAASIIMYESKRQRS